MKESTFLHVAVVIVCVLGLLHLFLDTGKSYSTELVILLVGAAICKTLEKNSPN